MSSIVNIRENLTTLSSRDGAPAIQSDLGTIVSSFISLSLIIGALLSLFFMILGGIGWITAGGDTGKIEKARSRFMQSIVGLAVLASTWAIFLVIQYFLGISIGSAPGGGGGGNGGGGNAGGGACTPPQTVTAQEDYGYCLNGAAVNLKCFGPGEGVSKYSWNHWEPCDCAGGAANRRPGVNFDSC